MQATFQNGNKEITITIVGQSAWEKDEMARVYFDLQSSDKKRDPIRKLYEVVKGDTRDDTIEVSGRTFGYELGICCDSKTKRREAEAGIRVLIEQIAA